MADIQLICISGICKCPADFCFDPLIFDCFILSVVSPQFSILSKFHEIFQRFYAFCFCSSQIDLIGCHNRKHHHFTPGTGHRNIQTFPSSIPVQRSEIHGQLSFRIRSECHGKEDHITLISLDILQIFDKQRLFFHICPFIKI